MYVCEIGIHGYGPLNSNDIEGFLKSMLQYGSKYGMSMKYINNIY